MVPLILVVLLTTLGCGSNDEGIYHIPLTDSLQTAGSNRYQVYFVVADSARWVTTVAAADTVVRYAEEDDRLKFRSGGIWYTGRYVDGVLRASQHYPGWERRIDSVARRRNVVRLLDNRRAIVDIPAAQAVLGGDSVTIGLLRVRDRAFAWQEPLPDQPDYLVLLPRGEEQVYIAMDADNIGPVGRQTVFRVGRRYYVLRAVAADYGSITVAEMPAARGMELTAELDTYYQPIPVRDLSGNDTAIRRRPGRELAVYFFSLGWNMPEGVVELDSIYRNLPAEVDPGLDVALVSRLGLTDSLIAFAERHDLQFPLYESTETTCRRLNCTAYLPNIVAINERGRIVTFQGRHEGLAEHLRSMYQ